MKWSSKAVFVRVAVAAFALGSAGAAMAQAWPTKPVRIIVPFGAGGGTDIQARLLAKYFNDSMKQTFIVDNRAGAGGLIGAELAVQSPPDGNTILFTTASLSVNVTLYAKRIKFDPLKDLAPVSWISSTPLVLIEHPSVPAKSVKELVALAKKTGKMNAGSNGAGTTSHLSIEMLKQATGINVAHVPYKGGGPAAAALLSGEVDFLFATGPVAMQHMKAGKVRGLAVTTKKKSSAFPDLPTMDSIYPGFESDNWYAMFFPKGTPKAIVDRLNTEIGKALKTKELQDFYAREALDAVVSTPAELEANFKREIARYAKIIKAGNITVE
ncbi:MAG TPA: tripartite tricarboxylate transporter substrate binding protein [Burkholderiales bacterium]|jgi:tripartite-type tricarboxylate transporter receptor subunit TctC|nr:tripartite tricarboxylate transporter substrate binding protein [Burkholderiales bacterium]